MNCDECKEKKVLQIDFPKHMMVVTRLYRKIRTRDIIIALSNIGWGIAVGCMLIK